MNKLSYSRILQSIRKWRTDERKRKAEIKKVSVRSEAEERIQIREWRGKIYICIDDVPLMGCLPSDDETLKMLEQMRMLYAAYHNDGNVK